MPEWAQLDPWAGTTSPSCIVPMHQPVAFQPTDICNRCRVPRDARRNAKHRPTLPLATLDHHRPTGHGREQHLGLLVLVLGRAVLQVQRMVRFSPAFFRSIFSSDSAASPTLSLTFL